MNNQVNELKQNIVSIQTVIKAEQETIKTVPEFLQALVVPKKQALIENLEKQVVKMQTEIDKIESKIKAEAEKEARQAPLKKLLGEIVNLKMTLNEQNELMVKTKSAYKMNTDQSKSAVLLTEMKQANDKYYATVAELEVKETEAQVLKESLKAK